MIIGLDWDDTVSEYVTGFKKLVECLTEIHIITLNSTITEEHAKAYLKDISEDKVPVKETIEAAKLKPRSSKSTKKDKLFPKTLVSTIENSPGIDRRLEELQRINYSERQLNHGIGQ